MGKYDYNSMVSRTEAEALKELIFRRARERAAAISNEINEEYTSDIRTDILDIANQSLKSTENPFAQLSTPIENFQQIQQTTVKKTEDDNLNSKTENKQVEPAIANNAKVNINHDLDTKVENYNQTITALERGNIIEFTGMDAGKRKNFIGALEFLNSQASMSIINRRKKGFDAIA